MPKLKKKLPDWMIRTLNKMDMEDFILVIKSQPVIWDTSMKAHNDQTMTNKAWQTVCATMDRDYEERDENEQYEFCQQLHKKWKNVRDSYRREIRRLHTEGGDPASTERRLYKYFDQLCFLEPALCIGQITSDKERLEENPEKKDSGSGGNKKKILSPGPSKRRKIKEEDDEDEDDDNDNITTTVSMGNTSKESAELCTHAGDGDALFMMSLISEMKKIPDNKRLQVKLKLMNIILEAQAK